MPEEATEAPENQDTPGDDAPESSDTATEESDDSQPQTNWEQRYSDLQPEYTRVSQEAAALRQQTEQIRTAIQIAQDPEHPQHAEALEVLGFEVEDSEDLDEDESEALQRRVEELEGRFSEEAEEREHAALEDAEWSWLDQEFSRLEKENGVELTDEEAYVVVGAALANRLEDDQPDLEGAFAALNKAWDTRQKNWKGSKKGSRPPGQGLAADRKLDLSNTEDRVAAMRDKIEALSS